ncbi:MAG: twin-arginine translocation signal domain-containing protein [Cytophagales bacterium]|nr:twin-arginine translocation signal domain-containing protein [Cytophagales bacterium]
MKKEKNISSTHQSRRDFIKKSALAIGAFAIVPRHVLGGPRFMAPSRYTY